MADKTKKEVMEKFGTENEFSKDSQRIIHSCTKCDKKFPRLQSLKRHEKIHNTDEKPFGCTKCNKSFITLEYLKKHIITYTLSFGCTK